MLVYKHRTIKLTPERHSDHTWSCAYRMIDISSTGWRFHTGHSYGSFRSREEAALAALEEAKQIVDALAPLTPRPWPTPRTVLRKYEKKIRGFFAWS